VLEAFADDRRRARNEAGYRAIRGRYDVVVEWPEGDAPERESAE